MKISNDLTDDAVLRELGERLAAARLARNLTQAALADQAGLSKRSVERLEAGAAGTQLSALVRLCRALGLADRLDLLAPEPAVSPMALLKLQGRARKRASTRGLVSASKKKWTWGDTP